MVEIRRHLHMNPEPSFKEKKRRRSSPHFMKSSAFPSGRMSGATVSQPILKGVNRDRPWHSELILTLCRYRMKKMCPMLHKFLASCTPAGMTDIRRLCLRSEKCCTATEKLKGSFVMIHQHAEELSPGGAKAMIEDGCLEHVDAIFGTHLWATEPVGTVLCRRAQ